jgi:hypothetical protein
MRCAHLIALVAVTACRSKSDERVKPASTTRQEHVRSSMIDPPAGAGAMAPQLRSDGDSVLATWLEPDGDAHRLMWSQWKAGAWTSPHVIAAGSSILANWADVPSIVRRGDGGFVASWAEKHEGNADASDAGVARSADGVTWSRFGPLHDDRTPTEHGFVSLVAENGGVRALWLDGRETAHKGPTTLRTAMVGETVGASTVVDERVCDCCSTAAATSQNAVLVAYRDRSNDEIRDIAVARADAATWSSASVAHDDWKIEGCPVNGPSIAADGDRVVVAWYTFAGNVHRVRAALSSDGGRTFSTPIDVATGAAERALLGRVGVVLDRDGSAIVSWVAVNGAHAALLLRRVRADRHESRETAVAQMSPDRDAGVPRIARDGTALVVMWTETGSAKHLRAVRVESAEVP